MTKRSAELVNGLLVEARLSSSGIYINSLSFHILDLKT